ncbi:4Fe-4S binding protein [Thiolapillus sp.]|uniref:4Fe-4S binding protein n=2 Tax=Thiolapillus sp. TaxID=2017437 RepID=UPI003AF6F07F
MTTATTNLAETIGQELRLPDIDPEYYVYAVYDQASCQACVDACPGKAWILTEESLGLDTDSCNGCGLCVSSCPSGALHMHFPWTIRHFGGKPLALFACGQAGLPDSKDVMPCVHALGTRQLMVMHTAGITDLLIAQGDCSSCPMICDRSILLQERIEHLNRLLSERHLAPMKLLSYSNAVWRKIYKQEEIISRGTLLKRRDFLGGSASRKLKQQMVILNPLNRSECQTIPPGALLPDAISENGRSWPWAPRFESTQCNGCDACIRLCPTDALQLSNSDGKAAYLIEEKYCTGCNICADSNYSPLRLSTSLPRWIYNRFFMSVEA